MLLYKSIIRSSLLYAAPVLTLGCDDAWVKLERLERRGLRAAARCGWASIPVAALQARTNVRPLVVEVRHTTAAFLLRHARLRNRHLLRAFASDVRQRGDLIRGDPPLERAFACLPDAGRRTVRTTLQEEDITDPWAGYRRTRGPGHTPRVHQTFEGISPF